MQAAVLAGAIDITGPHAAGEAESETTSVVGGFATPVVAYNMTDTANVTFPSVTDRKVCPGARGVGYAFPFYGNSWEKVPLPVPSGFATLWGDPALAVHQSTGTLFLSSVASPMATFNQAKSADGCVHGDMEMALTGACVARGTVTTRRVFGTQFKSLAMTADPARDCFGSEFYDGGTLATNSNFVYAAYLGADTSTIVVHRATPTGPFSQLPNPFPGKIMDGHPILLTYGGAYLLAADTSSNLWLTRFDEGPSTWTTPTLVSAAVNPELPVQPRGSRTFRQVSMSADMGMIGLITPEIRVIFSMPTFVGGVQLRGVDCRIDLMTCAPIPAWITSPTDHALLPSVKFAKLPPQGPVGVPDGRWVVSYWTDQGLADGSVHLARSMMDDGFSTTIVTPPQFPCPDNRGYWGDYDTTYVESDGTASPVFVRPFSDSSSGACSFGLFEASPVHVSLVRF
ncbi:MAG TPA: hypothetical protein VH374_00880 [Polyangia bacterium]|nr:hypothetical protein [Polyangia bacterium]